jgi:phosphate-selective porin OprO/OprP
MLENRLAVSLIVAVAGAAAAPAALAQTLEERVTRLEEMMNKKVADEDFRVYWKDGLRLDSHDGAFKLQIGGRTMVDFNWIDEDSRTRNDVGKQEDEVEFRRARLFMEGTIYERIIYKAEYDFEGGDADFKDVYMGVTDLPFFGTVKVGHHKEPFSLEELTSSKYITFLERSLPNAFAPSRNTGASFMNTCADDRVSYSVGAFANTNDFGDGSLESNGAVTARVTALPVYQDKGVALVHVGASYSRRSVTDDMLRVSSRPEVHTADNFVDTGSFAADGLDLYGLEAAVVLGPSSLQAEYIMAEADGKGATSGDPSFDGWYVYGSLFLTGEHRAYKTREAAFSRVKPESNAFSGDGGLGAIELTARYSAIDLDDRNIAGGQLDDVTLGINWYLNPNMRIMLNYISADLDKSGDTDALTLRFQVDF